MPTAKKPTAKKPAAKKPAKKKGPSAVRVEKDPQLGWICVCSDGGRRKATSVTVDGATTTIDFDHPEDDFKYGVTTAS